MPVDLSRYSAKELATLITQAKKRKTLIAKRKPAATVRRKIEAMAKAEGYAIGELFGTGTRAAAPAKSATRKAAGPKKGSKVAVKYRNPANPSETWSGRGKPPRWLAAELNKGKTKDAFAV